MTELLKVKKSSKFVWSREADNAFKLLKTALVSAPVLISPDYGKPFTIQTNVSDVGIGGVLTQGDGDEERVISYMSAKLTSAERKYNVTERECLAVLQAIKKFRSYIEESKFRVIIDHASLLWLKNLKNPQSRLARWEIKLQEFDCEIIHRKGKLNVVADALSRSVNVVDLVLNESSLDEEYRVLRENVEKDKAKYPTFLVKDNRLYKHCRSRSNDGI